MHRTAVQAAPAAGRLDGVKQLAVAREDVHHAVRPRRGQQGSLGMPGEDHRPLPVMSRVDHKQWIHSSHDRTPSLPLLGAHPPAGS